MKILIVDKRLRELQKRLDNYLNEDAENKETLQYIMFRLYSERNDNEFELTMEELKRDLDRLEKAEQYERCLMLKDIINRFE